MRRILPVVLVGLLVDRGALASSCADLVRSAEAHEAAHDDDLAARRYTEAVTLDATCEKGWLGLAALRVRQGDGREAERVAATAFEHLPAVRILLVSIARALAPRTPRGGRARSRSVRGACRRRCHRPTFSP